MVMMAAYPTDVIFRSVVRHGLGGTVFQCREDV